MSSRWVSKPPVGSQIEWGHPLSKGLVGCWLMNEGGGGSVGNLVTHRLASIDTSKWADSLKGKKIVFSGGTSHDVIVTKDGFAYRTGDPTNSPPTGCSIEFLLIHSAYEADKRFFAGRDAASSNTTVGFGSGTADNIKLRVYFRDSSNTTKLDKESSTSIETNGLYHIVWTDISGKPKLYINGKLDATDFSYTANSSFTVTEQCFGGSNRASTFANQWAGSIFYVRTWNRVLSPSEINSLYESPYQFVNGPSTITYFTAPVGGWVWGGEVKNVMVA